MKKRLLLILSLVLVIMPIHAQEAAEEVTGDIQSIMLQAFDSGEFVDTETENIYTLALSVTDESVKFLEVGSPFGLRQQLSFEVYEGLSNVEDLPPVEAVLDIDGQQVVLMLTNFVLDGDTLSVTAEVSEVIPTIDDKDAEELYYEFDNGELFVYFDAITYQLVDTSMRDLGGLRSPQGSGNDNAKLIPAGQ